MMYWLSIKCQTSIPSSFKSVNHVSELLLVNINKTHLSAPKKPINQNPTSTNAARSPPHPSFPSPFPAATPT